MFLYHVVDWDNYVDDKRVEDLFRVSVLRVTDKIFGNTYYYVILFPNDVRYSNFYQVVLIFSVDLVDSVHGNEVDSAPVTVVVVSKKSLVCFS